MYLFDRLSGGTFDVFEYLIAYDRRKRLCFKTKLIYCVLRIIGFRNIIIFCPQQMAKRIRVANRQHPITEILFLELQL